MNFKMMAEDAFFRQSEMLNLHFLGGGGRGEHAPDPPKNLLGHTVYGLVLPRSNLYPIYGPAILVEKEAIAIEISH